MNPATINHAMQVAPHDSRLFRQARAAIAAVQHNNRDALWAAYTAAYGRCSPRVCPSSTIVFANYHASVKPVFCSAACEIAKRHVSGEPKKETP